MSITKQQIQHTLDISKTALVDSLSSMVLDDFNFRYWPLFIKKHEDSIAPHDLDTCGDSVGIMAHLVLLDENPSPDDLAILNDTTKTLIWMRNDNGSWPSLIPYKRKSPQKMEGVINDTIFALSALINVGFLSNNPRIDIQNISSNLKISLTNLNDRIQFILASVEWLLANRINNGWYYTGLEYFESLDRLSPVLLPTAKLVVLFDSIIKSFEALEEIDHNLLSKLKKTKNEALSFIKSIQNVDKGFGKKRGEKSTIVHTLLAISALLRSDLQQNIVETINSAIHWTLKKKKYLIRNNLIEDLFDEYNQIIFDSDNNIAKRNIFHESFLEGLTLSILLEYYHNDEIRKLKHIKFHQIRKAIINSSYAVIELQEKEGSYMGTFRCHRSAPSERFPIYAISDSVSPLKILLKLYDEIFSKKYLIKTIVRNSIITSLLLVSTFLWAYFEGIKLSTALLLMFIQVSISIFISALQVGD